MWQMNVEKKGLSRVGVEAVSKRRRTKRKSCDTSIENKSERQQKDPNFGWHPDHKSVQQGTHPPVTRHGYTTGHFQTYQDAELQNEH